MKDLSKLWNQVSGRRYSSVNTADRELRELSNNRLKKCDIDSFEQNFTECEGLNTKFNEDIDFNERKDAIINGLFERRKGGRWSRQPRCLFVQLLLGFISLGLGFCVLFLHPYAFFFNQKVVLGDGGEIFEMWRKPQVDIYARIFLFNVTNSEEYMSGKDKKLKLQEVGPYVYKEGFEHNVTGFNDNGTLSSIPQHPLTWMEELSEGNREDDIVYLPHIALLSIANVASKKDFFTRFGLNRVITMTNSRPLMRMTAREFMMGFESKLMTLGNTFMPGWIYFDKLGLIDRMYDFNGDYETIFTGENDVDYAGLIDTYKGSTDLPQWDGKHCSNVQNASDGAKFKGGVKKNESLLFFRKSLCRAAPLIPTGEGVKSGLNAYLYTLPEHLLDNGKVIEENKCFCRKGICLPEGLIDVTDCYYGFPIALSYPHFYKGDEVLSSRVEGLNPNKEEHETRFWIEPVSGLPLDVSAKFQINMALGDISNIANTDYFSDLYLPLLWFDIRMYALPLSMEQRFKMYLNILPALEKSAMYISFLGGAFLITLSVYRLAFILMFKASKGKKQKNFVIGTKLWNEREKGAKRKDDIYAPCEIPLNESTDTESSDPQLSTERKPSLLKSHSDKIKELGHMLSDKVYDTAEGVKDKVKEEISHVKNIIYDRRPSLIPKNESVDNEAYKSDSSDSERSIQHGNYQSVKQTDSDEEFKYLEVIDDGEFDDLRLSSYNETNRERTLRRLDSQTDRDIILDISD